MSENKVAELERRLERAKEAQFCATMSDNYYYTSGRKAEADRQIAELETQLQSARKEQNGD